LSTINMGPVESPFIRQSATTSPRLSVIEVLERATGFLLSAFAAPVIGIAALVLTFLSRRSAFVAHLRVGKGGKPFWVLKLRTMWRQRTAEEHPAGWIEYIIAEPAEGGKNPEDPRVNSRFAVFCRRHSIDELPQLWNVARGEMSLVGPRPLTRSELDRHYGIHAAELLSVKPGITGLWQVYGRSAIRFPQRSAMDLKLVRTLSAAMYLRILMRTIPALVLGKGAW
jgi:exopolysaccharide production protein ExoY